MQKDGYKHVDISKMFDNIPIGLFLSDIDGTEFKYINKAFANIFEYSIEEMYSIQPSAVWANPRDREKFKETVIEEGSLVNFETEIITKSSAKKVLQAAKHHLKTNGR